MADPVIIGAGIELGKEFFRSVTSISSLVAKPELRAKYKVEDKLKDWESAFDLFVLSEKEFLDYAHTFQLPKNPQERSGSFPDILVGLSKRMHDAKAECDKKEVIYKQNLILFQREITGGAQ